MEQIVDAIGTLLAWLRIDRSITPILVFILLIAALYAVIFTLAWAAVRRNWVSRNTAAFWLFVSPWIVGFLLFTGGPMVYSLVLSLMDWNLIDPATFVGIDNYTRAAADPELGKAIQVTLTYAVISVPLQTVLSLGVALMMNIKIRGINVFRTLWYLPSLVTGVAQAVLFIWVFNPRYGLINGFLSLFGIEGPTWLFDENWALSAVIIMSLWTVGGNMVIYLAGLQDVPAELYEAADLDGAGRMRKLWHVTLPQVSPVIFFNVVTGLIYAMQTFTQGYVVTQNGGGPSDSLLFYVLYLYRNAFSFFDMGYASALAWILFVMIMALTVLVFRGSAFWVYYESQRPSGRVKGRRDRRVRAN